MTAPHMDAGLEKEILTRLRDADPSAMRGTCEDGVTVRFDLGDLIVWAFYDVGCWDYIDRLEFRGVTYWYPSVGDDPPWMTEAVANFEPPEPWLMVAPGAHGADPAQLV